MFVFIIARTPVKMRNSLRDELWKISLNSLMQQTSKNWKAIIVGDTFNDNLNQEFFISLNFDEYTKQEKIQIALDYINTDFLVKPEYLIRFDDDDIFSDSILTHIENLPVKYDCYFDKYHTYIDAAYLKFSHRKNFWIPNTAIHKYEYAITKCGKLNLTLLVQSHDEYWHIFYSKKKTFKAPSGNPLYYRILTPFSITSFDSNTKGIINWQKHLNYLKGYGPWINLPSHFSFYSDLKKVTNVYFEDKPKLTHTTWLFNKIKYLIKNCF